MARLPYLDADQVAPEHREMVGDLNLNKLLVHAPAMARAFNRLGARIRLGNTVDPRLRELAILQVGWVARSAYEFTHHVEIGRECGVTDTDIQAMIAETEGKGSTIDPLAKAVLAGAREMADEGGMSDATFASLSQELSDEQMVDLLVTTAFYCGVVRVLASLQIDLEPAYAAVLQEFPFPDAR
jgi:alkylhydroperoxidase family enzyme